MKYYISSYDIVTDEIVLSIETTLKVFKSIKESFSNKIKEHSDCYVLTVDMIKLLEDKHHFKFNKDPNIEWFIELFSEED